MENKKIYMVTELTETTNEPQVAQPNSSESESTPTGIAAEKPCFITVAIPESIKQIVDIKGGHIHRRNLADGRDTQGVV